MKYSPLWPYVKEVDQRAGHRAESLPLLSVSQTFGVRRHSEVSDKPARADDLGIYKLAAMGDVILNRMSATKGAVGVASEPGLVSPDYAVLRSSREVDPRYIYYLLKSSWGLGQISMMLRGIGSESASNVRTQRVSIRDLLRIKWPLPLKWAQGEIADYLARETAEIDAFIADLRLLEEITHERYERAWSEAFASASLFEARRVKFVVNSLVDGPFGSALTSSHYSDEGSPVVRLGNIGRNEFVLEPRVYVPNDYARQLASHAVEPGDVVIAGLGDLNHPLGPVTKVA